MQPRTTSPNGQGPRALRADAQRNYDLLVAAADAAFTEHGADASLEDIARRAGVGIGTLYRHFPTRDALLAKVLDDSARAIVARGDELAEVSPPSAALMSWLEALIGYVTTYSGLSKSLAAGLAKDDCSELGGSCQAMSAAGSRLLVRAQDAGELRADASIDDIVMSVHAAVWAAEQMDDPSAAPRLVTMVVDGLRVDAARRAVARPRTRTPRREVKAAARPAARRR